MNNKGRYSFSVVLSATVRSFTLPQLSASREERTGTEHEKLGPKTKLTVVT